MKRLLTRYDWLLARRAFALGSVLTMVLAVVIATTGDVGATMGERLGMLSAVVALAGGVAAFVAGEQARARGELRGLAAIGVAPGRAPFGAALGGSIIALLGPALASMKIVDVDSLYPRVSPSAGAWTAVGPGAWRHAVGSVVVRATGELDISVGAIAPPMVPSLHASRLSTGAALLAFAIAVPFWATAKGNAPRRLIVALSVAVCSATLFHLVAVGRAPAGVLALPPLALLLDAWALGRSGAWS